jgi:hypothetical protein
LFASSSQKREQAKILPPAPAVGPRSLGLSWTGSF